jgi:zinc/manganese transport system substrate-binding protein
MRTVLVRRVTAAVLVGAALLGSACSGQAHGSDDGRVHLVVTTSILGDVVKNLVGDDARVDVLMPPGTDPHEFAASARQVVAMRDADLLVINGLGFEAGLTDAIQAAEDDGARVITAVEGTDALPLGAEPDRHDGERPLDPHFFTDPVRMAEVTDYLAGQLAARVASLDATALHNRAEGYVARLRELDADVTRILSVVPAGRRVLVTNHEVFGYFAARYHFTVLGAVIPGGSTLAGPSAADLHRLAALIHKADVPAIFAETSSPTRLAEALAAEGAGPVEVVQLYSESLGPAGSDGSTYIDMVRTNASLIAGALG